MRVELIDDPGAFAVAAGALLTGRIDGTILATVLDVIRGGGGYSQAQPRFAVVRDGRAVVAAALRTPPWPMLCCGLDVDDADRLVAEWLARDADLPGVNATPPIARAIGDAWARRTGGRHELQTAMALHALEAVTDPRRPATGRLRRAQAADEETIIAWARAFDAEAHGHEDTWRGAEAGRRLLDAGRAYVWEDRGRPVSMLGHSVSIDAVPRVGPVYTPPQLRGRGYAGHAVAQLSRCLLAEGARRIVLFTNLANPTSNKIYAEVGYRRVSDWEERGFVPATQAAAESATG